MTATMLLDKMTTSEKLLAVEEIWEDLCRNPEDVPSPAWHGDILEKRSKRIQEGKAKFMDWNEAKQKTKIADKQVHSIDDCRAANEK